MARRAAPLAVVVALCASGCMRARGTPEEPVVTGVELHGAKALDSDAILARIATQPSGRFAFQEVRRLQPDALATDRRRIEAYYRDHGYYDAKVTDVRVEGAQTGRAKVVFVVDEGAPVRVTKIDIEGLDDAPAARDKLGSLPLRVGGVFDVGAYDGTRARIVKALRTTGWANGEVKQDAHVFPSEHAAEVRYQVTPGERFKFGPILPAGSASVPRDRIRREAEIEIHPGDWFDEDKLAKAQARVFDLGVFGGVRVLRGPQDPQRGIIPIVVAVKEAPFKTIRAGPGLGIEANTRWDLHAMVGWTDRDFLGDLRRLQLDLRAGYAWLLAGTRKKGPIMLASAQFSQPGAISQRVDASTRLEIERGLEPAYDFWSERLRFAFPIRIVPRLTLVPSYNLEVYQLSNAIQNFNPNQPTTTGPALQACVGQVCLLSYLEQRVGWDGRNNPVEPRRGAYFMLTLQEGFNLSGYGYTYLRFLPEARAFTPLSESVVLAARARLGALIPVGATEDPPIVARFLGGGPLSMRGYYSGRFAPMFYDNGDWVPVGGNGLADGSVELRFPIAGDWGGAAFFDGAAASAPSSVPSAWRSVLHLKEVQWATGVAVRYRTPFGPIRVDIGFRLPTDLRAGIPWEERFPAVPVVVNAGDPIVNSAGEVVGTVPSIHREPWFAVHLSLGEAF